MDRQGPDAGFNGVDEAVWNFHIGGYQVCQKWLKDRKGRTLAKDDITRYGNIVAALDVTIRIMRQIDEVVNQHGGWPGAFASEEAGLHTTAATSDGRRPRCFGQSAGRS